MMIQIRRESGHVSAMGHRVSEAQGGERELKRRCLETISHYDSPPDEISFKRFDSSVTVLPTAPAIAAAQMGKQPGVAKAKERRAR